MAARWSEPEWGRGGGPLSRGGAPTQTYGAGPLGPLTPHPPAPVTAHHQSPPTSPKFTDSSWAASPSRAANPWAAGADPVPTVPDQPVPQPVVQQGPQQSVDSRLSPVVSPLSDDDGQRRNPFDLGAAQPAAGAPVVHAVSAAGAADEMLDYDVDTGDFVRVQSPPRNTNPFTGLPKSLQPVDSGTVDPERAASPNPFKPLRDQIRIVRLQRGPAGFGFRLRPRSGLGTSRATGGLVIKVEKDGPAAASSAILAADVIEELDNTPALEMPYQTIVERLSRANEVVLRLQQDSRTTVLQLGERPEKDPLGISVAVSESEQSAQWWPEIVSVKMGSIAERIGMRIGDMICDCDELSSLGATQDEIVGAIKSAADEATVTIMRGSGPAAVRRARKPTLRRQPTPKQPKKRVTAGPVFRALDSLLKSSTERHGGGCYVLDAKTPGGVERWTLDLTSNEVYMGEPRTCPEVTVALGMDTLEKWLNSDLPGGLASAFMMGKLKVSGDRKRAMHLVQLEPLVVRARAIVEGASTSGQSNGGRQEKRPATNALPTPHCDGPESGVCVAPPDATAEPKTDGSGPALAAVCTPAGASETDLKNRIATAMTELAGTLNQCQGTDGTFLLRITLSDGGYSYLLDFNEPGSPAMTRGGIDGPESAAAETTATMGQDVLVAWLAKEIEPMTAFMEGRLTVEGDQMRVMQLSALEPLMHAAWEKSAAPQRVGGTTERIHAAMTAFEDRLQNAESIGADGVFLLAIDDGAAGFSYALDFSTTGACAVRRGDGGGSNLACTPDTSVFMKQAVFVRWLESEIDPMTALMEGHLQVTGDQMKVLQLAALEPLMQASWRDSKTFVKESLEKCIDDSALTARVQSAMTAFSTLLQEAQSVDADGSFLLCIEVNPESYSYLFDFRTPDAPVIALGAARGADVNLHPDATVSMKQSVLLQWLTKEVDPMTALMSGALTVSGDQMKLLQLASLEPMMQSAWASTEELALPRPSMSAAECAQRVSSAMEVFGAELGVTGAEGVFLLCITSPTASVEGYSYLLDLGPDESKLIRGGANGDSLTTTADTTVTMEQDVFVRWLKKEIDPMSALMEGLLQVAGDQMKVLELATLEPLMQAAWDSLDASIPSPAPTPEFQPSMEPDSAKTDEVTEGPVADDFGFPLLEQHRSLYTSTKARTYPGPEVDDVWQLMEEDHRAGLQAVIRAKILWQGGIPQLHRQSVWRATLQLFRSMPECKGCQYDEYLTKAITMVEAADMLQIDCDVPRTFVEHPRFAVLPDGSLPADSLLPRLDRILRAACVRNAKRGYWQGMAFIAAFTLLVFDGVDDEEDAFWAVVFLLETVFNSIFDLHGVRISTATLEGVMLELMPKLYGQFLSLRYPISTFTTRWLVCGFACTLPSETAMRLWDALVISAAGHMLSAKQPTLKSLAGPIADSGVDLLILFSISMFRIHESVFLTSTDSTTLRDVVQILAETQFDHDLLTQAAYHEVLGAAARVDDDGDPGEVWGPGFAWSRFVSSWRKREATSTPDKRRNDSCMSA